MKLLYYRQVGCVWMAVLYKQDKWLQISRLDDYILQGDQTLRCLQTSRIWQSSWLPL